MANSNVLEGMACPNCGSEEPFRIVAECIVNVYDDGTEEATDLEWDSNSYCMCLTCRHEGTVDGFATGRPDKI